MLSCFEFQELGSILAHRASKDEVKTMSKRKSDFENRRIVTTQIRLSGDLYVKLKAAAQRDGLSLNAYMTRRLEKDFIAFDILEELFRTRRAA